MKAVEKAWAKEKADGRVLFTTTNDHAIAALKSDGQVVTWGAKTYGGDASLVKAQLVDVQAIYGNDKAFAAVTADGNIAAWGNAEAQTKLDGVAKSIIQNGAGTPQLKCF